MGKGDQRSPDDGKPPCPQPPQLPQQEKKKNVYHNFPVNEKVRRFNIIREGPSAAEANCARHIRINQEKKPTKRFTAVGVGEQWKCRNLATNRKQL